MDKPTLLVTGGSHGIGKAIALTFGKAGYNVIVNYHKSREAAEALVSNLAQIGANAWASQANVGQREQVQAMINTAIAKFGKIDVLINNAGIANSKLFTDLTEAEWDEMMLVNLKGVFNCTQLVLPPMISRKHGKIINISSIWGMVGAACEVDYSAAKGGVIALTKALAKELGPSGIQVNAISPGVIATQMNGDLTPEELNCLADKTPLGRIGSPADIAELALFLASPQADFITGQNISPNGGFVI